MQATDLLIAPIPKRLLPREGEYSISDGRLIRLDSDDPQSLIPAARQTGLSWDVTASPKAPKEKTGLIIRLDESSDIPAEGYKLTIRPNVIEIIASTPAGAFYGACTLKQIVRQCNEAIPCLAISDWPDFPARGVMLDVSRDKVPTMETIFHLIDMLAEWKINEFQLYTEHAFAYLAHPVVWENADPMTGEQIMALDAYCRERFIDLVPNQNSFAHMERWLKHDQYRPMAEHPHGGETAWGHRDYPYSLSPADKRCIPFLAGLYDELLPHFTSGMFNVGLDETVDLGFGRSKKLCDKIGKGRVYLDFLLSIHQLVCDRGRTMQFWGDIILHHPELIPELPQDIIALDWGYEAKHPFAKETAQFADAGIAFYVCPGTSSWNTISGRTDNAIANIVNSAKNGLKNGAVGMLNTDWGDNGHWQPLPVSYLGFLAGAMTSWNARADVRRNIEKNLSLNAFGDASGKMGRAFYDIGNVYKIFGKNRFNQSVPWQMLFKKMDDAEVVKNLETRHFDEMDERLGEIAQAAMGDSMTIPDADIVRREFDHVLQMLRLSSTVGRVRLGQDRPKDLQSRIEAVKENHEQVWLLRNRLGGLSDSKEKMIAG